MDDRGGRPRSGERLGALGCVVLHYRHWPGVGPTIDALLDQGVDPALVCIVDNGSGDGSAERLRAAYPQVTVVGLAANDGYATGMNAGVASLPAVDAVLLLTHDCLLAPGALAALVGRLRDDATIGAVGPLLEQTSKPGQVFSAGGTLKGRTRQPAHLGSMRPVSEYAGSPPAAVEWVDGACLMVRMAALADAGPIDEGYFLYFEELDFCTRLRRHGWRVECDPSALARQEPGRQPRALWVRNRLRYVRRNYDMSVFSMRVLADIRDVAVGLGSRDRTRRHRGWLGLRGLVGYCTRRDPKRLHRLG